MLVLISSCQRDHKKKEVVGYEISGQITNAPDSMSVMISNLKFSDSTIAVNGKFSFVGNVDAPQKAGLSLNSIKHKSFWLENAQITITGDYDNLEYAEFTGGENQRIANLLWDKQKSIRKLMVKLDSRLKDNSLEKLKRDSIQDAYRYLRNKLDDIDKKFVKENPNTLESVIKLGVRRSKWNKDSVRTIFSTMNKATQNTEFGILISEYLKLSTNPQIGDRYIDVSLKNTDDETVNLSQLTGTLTLIDFWASWCIPCREENPSLVELFEKYNNNGFNIIGVSMDADKSKWLKAIEDDRLPWDHLIDLGGLDSNNIFLLYDVRFIPDNLLVDQDGIILARNLRGGVLEKKLKEIFRH